MAAPVSFREKVRFFSLALRAPSIHGTEQSKRHAMSCPQLVLCQEDAKASCCTKDEGWPFGVAL
jgi:hypothetical protein